MSTDNLTKIQKILIYGLKQLSIRENRAKKMVMCLEEEDDQVSMIKYLLKNPNSTQLQTVKEFARLVEKRNKINKETNK